MDTRATSDKAEVDKAYKAAVEQAERVSTPLPDISEVTEESTIKLDETRLPLTELGRIYQKNEEDVITYANRVRLLGNRIMDVHKRMIDDYAQLTEIRNSLEKDVCKCFIRGLKSEIEQRVKRDLGVHETVTDALDIERELREINDLRYGKISSTPKPLNTDRPREICQLCLKEGHAASTCKKLASHTGNYFSLPNEILVCQICKKRGHSADKCRQRETNNRRFINIIQENTSNCQLCNKPGHNAKNCRFNNSNQNRTVLICQWCEKSGHTANNCWKKQQESRITGQKPRTVCQICDGFGHLAKECRNNARQNSSKETEYCRYCKKDGHVLENCELRITNNKRREAMNAGNAGGPSKTGVQQGSGRISHPVVSVRK
ncbi:hypothetical protein PUN28_003740 [Cardiocondyla obscurior]|uniref:CCHC-type domain-containing protein n=1 Tax=Cardiocondyla obscurior TaxID=286306 RepID=A0AAW2GLK2_9HYME